MKKERDPLLMLLTLLVFAYLGSVFVFLGLTTVFPAFLRIGLFFLFCAMLMPVWGFYAVVISKFITRGRK